MRRAILVLAASAVFGVACSDECPVGSEGCACPEEGEACANGLACEEGSCRLCNDDGCVPVERKCYTPCQQSFVTLEGQPRECAATGLVEGCIDGAQCIGGNCVSVEAQGSALVATSAHAQTAACTRDVDCPFFKACIAGQCYSMCEENADCKAGRTCHQQVCRLRCGSTTACSAGLECRSEGNTQNVCLPIVPPSSSGTTPNVLQPYALERPCSTGNCAVTAIDLDTNRTSTSFDIANSSPVELTFRVRKLEQVWVDDQGLPQRLDAAKNERPLSWLQIGPMGSASAVEGFEIKVPARGRKTIQLSSARSSDFFRWQGKIQVTGPQVGMQTLALSYNEAIPGRWSGRVYYFGSFGDHTTGSDQLEDWRKAKTQANAELIPNAFMRAWANFRSGRVPLDQMQAVLQATLTGSWDFARTKELCASYYPSGAICAPYAGSGNRPVTAITLDPRSAPMPSGVVELGISVNLGAGQSGDCAGGANCFAGKIDSANALQYPADPKVEIAFEANPSLCTMAMGSLRCVSYLSAFDALITVGGRHLPAAGTSACANSDFMSKTVPWLVPGFLKDALGHPLDNFSECRDTVLPFANNTVGNQVLAAANPVPDGNARTRSIQLIDGIVVDQRSMFVIFRETTQSFLGANGSFSSYGYMVLDRQPEETQDTRGNKVIDPRTPLSVLEAGCKERIIDLAFPTGGYSRLDQLPADARDTLANVLVDGRTSGGTSSALALDPNLETAGYYCTWNELQASLPNQDGSQPTTGNSATTVTRARINGTCPPYARVIYYALESSAPASAACEDVGCTSQLNEWVAGEYVRLSSADRSTFPNAPDALFNLRWSCTDPDVAFCDNERDMLAGKTFYRAEQGAVVFNSLRSEVKEAFRYKTQFQNRDGQSVGFAPETCDDSTRIVPYCYDPDAILEAMDRVDCAVALYDRHTSGTAVLSPVVASTLKRYLDESFGYSQIPNPLGDPRIDDGFERLFAELMVMLGDDGYTASFASRFDLAGTRLATFPGSELESGGVEISGVAGFELYKLYQATQYYQAVLDRFFRQAPLLWRNVELPAARASERYLSSKTVTGYVTRVIRASTQQSNAWNEIARRYQALNRGDLARKVIERSYARAYMESLILSELMRRIQASVPGSQQDQVTIAIQDAQRRYRVAMLDMQSAYRTIRDDKTVFGFAPDYIPFPALDESEINAMEVLLDRAHQRLDVAAEDETRALESNRSFETDAALFQSELVSIRNNYEKQLGDLCGTFVAEDGRTYPAIERYAHLDRRIQSLGDPCGYDRGQIWVAAGDLTNSELGLRRLRQEATNLKDEASDLITLVNTQCNITVRSAAYQRAAQAAIDDLQLKVDRMTVASENLGRILGFLGSSFALGQQVVDSNSPLSFLGKLAISKAYDIVGIATLVAQATLDGLIVSTQDDIREQERNKEFNAALYECEQFAATGSFELNKLKREVLLKNLDILMAMNDVGTAVSQLQSLLNEKLRLEAEWEETSQLTINVEAARNDPNVRIYKNDAIINADRSFTAAIREAYRATKVFEYYTSQSYAKLDKLFLTRMVNAGDVNLSQYLVELEDAFFEFEEAFGNPAIRVEKISLRDDILGVSQTATNPGATPLSTTQRVELMRRRLTSGEFLDHEGNNVIPFSTEFAQLSPRTHNHKIFFLETEVQGQDTGDDLARIYVRQHGSSAVATVDGGRLFYAFPPRTAVLNPFFTGEDRAGRAAFDIFLGGAQNSLFRDYRMRDRPFVNSNWELILNTRTEPVNQDIDLEALDDIVLYIYYFDFTSF